MLLDEPWSWLLEHAQPLSSKAVLNGAGSPRVLIGLRSGEPRIALPPAQPNLPPASFPFLVGAEPARVFHLPTDPREHRQANLFVTPLTVGEMTSEVRQTGCVARPAVAKDEEPSGPTPSHGVSAWIDWQIWAFQELGHLPRGDDPFDAGTRASCVRRSWDAAMEVWLRDGRERARMALIVELSRQQTLHRALDAISRHPRRVLQRAREEMPLGRIQELDPACIRHFARRPGMTIAEKAGPRQQLLAVRRREQHDTLENRVARWVLESIAGLARDYCWANSNFAQDGKVRGVRSFGRRASTWRASEPLDAVGVLQQHPTSPNYPLQFEPRYRVVWNAYLRIRREKTVLDDAWAWQRTLWGETGRQLLGCCLHRLFDAPLASTPFYRVESRQGCWTEPPVAPGPFRSPWGECFVFDSRDLGSSGPVPRGPWLRRPPFAGAEYVGATGCDQVLLWPESKRALLIWHFYHAQLGGAEGGLPGILERCAKALDILGADLRRFAQASYWLSGLLLVADLSGALARERNEDQSSVVTVPGPRLGPGGAVNSICLPPDADNRRNFVQDLLDGLGFVFEEFHR